MTRPRRSNEELAAVLLTHANEQDADGFYTFAATLREAADALKQMSAGRYLKGEE